MSPDDQETIFVRVIEIPSVKMVRSGSADLDAFDQWWSSVDDQLKNRLFPHDFMWFNPQLGNMEWLYVLPEGMTDTSGYEVFEFPGGYYAVAACKDDGAEIETTSQKIHKWIEQSPIFEMAPESSGRYEMGHVITPKNAKEILGYHQMDLFVPIVPKTPAE
ncbi:MAG: transcriptional regulator [Omnitrophica WOR_2 bacterium]